MILNAASNSATPTAPRSEETFRGLLRDWRRRRLLDRRGLARAAGLSTARLAEIESAGRGPDKAELAALAVALGLSLADSNALIAAAGQAPVYRVSDLAAPAMAEARRAITFLLSRHEPFPAIVTDHHWEVLAANDAAQRLFRMMLGEARVARPMNLMRLFLAPDELRRHIVNWPALAGVLLSRVRRDAAAAPDDDRLRSLWRELRDYPDAAAAAMLDPPPGALCEVRFAAQGRELGLIGTVSAFAAPLDVTLEQLRIEAFIPADDASEALLFGLAGQA
ncbi:MAG: helix-turn-helix domain-containing protein [Caulobacter sp.]|nr:helix-turn-helix domain-containing protein [Caulobacter sp.]